MTTGSVNYLILTVLNLVNFADVLFKVLDVFLVHLLFGCLKLLQSSLSILPNELRQFPNQLCEFIGLHWS